MNISEDMKRVTERAKWRKITGTFFSLSIWRSPEIYASILLLPENEVQVSVCGFASQGHSSIDSAKRYAEDELRRVLTEALERLPQQMSTGPSPYDAIDAARKP